MAARALLIVSGMTTRTMFAGLVTLVLLASAGCMVGATEDAEGTSSALAGSTPLTCAKLTVERGRIGSGQSAAALATRDQSGTQDTWSKYVELAPNTSVVCTFNVPAGAVPSSLRVNYRGPKKQQMLWRFEAFDASTSSWVPVGDNAFAADWVWSATELALTNASRFVANGAMKIRYATTSNADASQLDELVVMANGGGTTATTDAGTTTTTDAGTTTTTDAGTTTAPPPPSPSPGIWRPSPGTSWQWQLTGTIDTTVNASVFDIDLWDTPQATIDKLHGLGRKVVCYFDTAYEPNRPDSAQLAPYRGNPIKGWPGQYWLDQRAPEVLTVMKNRLALAQQKKCDAVEADDVDARANNPGFPITAAQQQAFIRALAVDAHTKGMSFALKNDLEEIPQLLADVDFAVNEECLQYDECSALSPFISAGKAVFHTEYGSASLANSVCPKTKPLGFSTLIKNLDLDAWRVACP